MQFYPVFIAIGKAFGTFAPTSNRFLFDKIQKKNLVGAQNQQQHKQELRYCKHKNADVASDKAKDNDDNGNIEPGFNEHAGKYSNNFPFRSKK
jgi:hypothetical protein